jgi:hypothetical protein
MSFNSRSNGANVLRHHCQAHEQMSVMVAEKGLMTVIPLKQGLTGSDSR